jgi:multimeric flavodoxin WrbA
VEGTAWVAVLWKRVEAEGITTRLIRIRRKHVELCTTYNKFLHCCIKLDSHLPYDYDARLHKPQS